MRDGAPRESRRAPSRPPGKAGQRVRAGQRPVIQTLAVATPMREWPMPEYKSH